MFANVVFSQNVKKLLASVIFSIIDQNLDITYAFIKLSIINSTFKSDTS